jgi:dihydroorotase
VKPLLIKNGRVVDPASGLDDKRDVLIEAGRIAALDKNIARADAEVFDASNLIVAPGFIDLHVHLREPARGRRNHCYRSARRCRRRLHRRHLHA